MTFAAEWSTATRFGPAGHTVIDDAPHRPERGSPALDDEASAEAATDADVTLDALVRQWLRMTESVERLAGEADPATSADPPPVVHRPGLPRQPRASGPRPARRLAVLIDAETTTPESADALFDVLADQGVVSVCRAYADWTSPESRAWSAPLGQHSIQPYHHFGDEQDQRAIVALTIDAVDLARESAVDAVAIVGDLTSLHPLVARLNASGLQVLAFGTASTPHDVRALCHEFVDVASLGILGAVHGGRHRA